MLRGRCLDLPPTGWSFQLDSKVLCPDATRDPVTFQQQLQQFYASHAWRFASDGLKEDWAQLHEEYQLLFEKHLALFIRAHGMRQKEFAMLTNRYATHLGGEEEAQWNSFLARLPSVEDFGDFVKLMKQKARSKIVTTQVPVELPAGIVRFLENLDMRPLKAFICQHRPSFQVKYREHRHEWYLLHQEFRGLFETLVEEAVQASALELEDLAVFLMHNMPWMETPSPASSASRFAQLLGAAEDYMTFVKMLKAKMADDI
ncbi:unnamed protein product [Durusdinium trenchii]|uniref:Cilia- and flagella-associated protein 36 n=1 Tax=Durusdinium trenchii TaxID=1381693 RepID=A0ABP0SVL7_9DINO